MEFTLEHAMDIAVEAAVSAGVILIDMLETASAREKAPKDLVTDADVASQSAIESMVMSAFPKHQFIGEESSEHLDLRSLTHNDWTWIVDPLDGTANYVHRLPNFAVSIALLKGDDPVLGVVYDPTSKELFRAMQSCGATLNGKPIRSSPCIRLDQAMVAASFPPKLVRESREIGQFIEVLLQSQSVRRLGSAALNLCYVSCGRLDAYWANQLKAWDIAAGVLMARESGAVLGGIREDTFQLDSGEILAAASPSLWQEMKLCLGRANPLNFRF